jgi:cell wall-associated NlpC family hydrolase
MTFPEKVARIARTWIGTPFYPHQARKGVGCDCVSMARAVFEEAGLVPSNEKPFPQYDMGGSDHLKSSLVVEWLATCKWFEPRDGMPRQGDVVTFAVGKVAHHVGIMVTDKMFVQAIRRYGVVELPLRDSTWSKRLRTVWRPIWK